MLAGISHFGETQYIFYIANNHNNKQGWINWKLKATLKAILGRGGGVGWGI